MIGFNRLVYLPSDPFGVFLNYLFFTFQSWKFKNIHRWKGYRFLCSRPSNCNGFLESLRVNVVQKISKQCGRDIFGRIRMEEEFFERSGWNNNIF